MSSKAEKEKPNMLPLDANGRPVPERRTQKFVYEDDEPVPQVQVTDMGFAKGRTDVSGLVVPLGNIADADVINKRSSKPAMKDPKSKWSGKGEQLSTEAAIQFMIKERAMMDLETAQLRRDNEKLRRSLDQKMAQNDRTPQILPMTVPVKAGLSPKGKEGSSDSDLREQLAQLKADNERLKLQHLTQGKDGSSSPIPAPPSSIALAQAAGAALLSPPPCARHKELHLTAKQEEVNVISSMLWDGGYLWKIPYNGKGAAERRIIALKRATVFPSPSSRAVRIDRAGSLSPPENYIAFPPTLMWYNSDKPGQIKNARELILYEGTCLMEGHNTNAFYKLSNSDRPIPKPELCFSMMTTTRSLDLAAETEESALQWKDAMHALLVEFSPNRAWAAVNLRRNKPFWDQKALEDIPPPTSAGNLLPQVPPASQAQSEVMSKREARLKKKEEAEANSAKNPKNAPSSPRTGKPMKKEVIKRQLFAAARAKDFNLLEQLFQAGVPANLQDETTENDTPLMIACRLNDADSARVCLQYGAKNDPHPDFGDTALHLATDFGNYDVAAIILSAAAQSEADHMIANLTNEEKKTPLHLAAQRGYLELIELLLEHGADLETKDELDQTALHVCSAAGHRECLATLLDQGGDHLLEYPDLGGNTALHHAAQGGHWHCIKLLLETAADCMVRNSRGQTAYKLSVDQGHQQIAKLLLEYTKDYQNASNKGHKRAAADVTATGGLNSPVRHSIDNSVLTANARTPNAPNTTNSLYLSIDAGEQVLSYGMDPDEGAAEVSLNVHAHLPPSPQKMHGTPMGKLAMGSMSPHGPCTPNAAAALPRPHSGSGSPAVQGGKRFQQQGQGQGLYGNSNTVSNGQYSPVTQGMSGAAGAGAGGYSQPVGGRSRAASDGLGYDSPAQPGYEAAYDPMQQQHEQYMSGYTAGGLAQQPRAMHQQHQPPYDPSGAGYGYSPGSARMAHAPHLGADAYANSPNSARERPTPTMFDGMNVQYGHDPSHEQQQYHQQQQQISHLHAGMSPIQSWNGQHGQHMQSIHAPVEPVYAGTHQQQYGPNSYGTGYEPYDQSAQYDQTAHDAGSYGTNYTYDVNSNGTYEAPNTYSATQHHAPPSLSRAFSEPTAHRGGHDVPVPAGPKGPVFYAMDPTASVAMVPVEHEYATGGGGGGEAVNVGEGETEHAVYLDMGSGSPSSASYGEGAGGGAGHMHKSRENGGSVGLWIEASHDDGEHEQHRPHGSEGHHSHHDRGTGHSGTAGGGEDNIDEAAAVEGALEEFEACDRYWSVYQTDDGHVYYLDAAAEHSQWEDPRTHGLVYETYAEEGTAYDEEFSTYNVQQSEGTEDGAGHDQNIQGSTGAACGPRSLPSPKSSPPKCPSPKNAGRRSPSFQPDYNSRHNKFFPENDGNGSTDINSEPVQKALFVSGGGDEGPHMGPSTQPQTQKQQPQKPMRYDISDDSASEEDEGKDSNSGGPRVRIGAVGRAKGRSVARTNEPLRKSSADAISSSTAGGRHGEERKEPEKHSNSRGRDVQSAVSQSVDSGTAVQEKGPKAIGGIAAKVEAIARRRASQREASLERNASTVATAANADMSAADSKDGEFSAPTATAAANSAWVPPGRDLSSKAADKKSDSSSSNGSKDTSAPPLFASSAKDAAPPGPLNLQHPSRVSASSAESKDYKAAMSPIQKPPAAEKESVAPVPVLSKEERRERYMQMLRNGEPLRVVRRSMEDADEDKVLVKEIMALADSVSPVPKPRERPPAETTESAGESAAPTAAPEKAATAEKITDLRADAAVGKYAKMVSMGVPHGSVAAKMKADAVEVAQMNRVLLALGLELELDPDAPKSADNSGAATAPVIVKEDMSVLKADPVVGKYAKMASMGVPHGSVMAKMKVDGIAVDQMNRILVGLGIEPEEDTAAVAVPPAAKIPKEDMSVLKTDPVVGKYAKMASMGVPPSSVAAKMKSDAVAVDQRNRVLVALDLDPEVDVAAAAAAGAGAGAGGSSLRAALLAGPGKGMQRRPSVKMQSLHWDPISQDKLDKSIWAQAEEGDKEHVNDADVREIEKLFALAVDNKKETDVAVVKKKATDPASVLVHIDGKRAQNVTIGINQYKNVAPDTFTLLRAVCSLDKLDDRLKVDHLENLGALLPTPQEVAGISKLSGSAHPAEMFLATACKFYPDLPKRLECYLHMTHLAESCESGLGKATKLVEACNEIISNDKLARVLQKMLAVGNVMNQGTYRGNATGFTVDSLLRMINMKGADKKTTVLDYVVKSLYDRGEERVLVVAEDLAVLESASKISGTEIGKQLGEVDSTYEFMQQELTKVKEQLKAGDAGGRSPQPNGVSSPPPPAGGSNMSELFARRLEQHLTEQLPRIEEVRRYRRLLLRKVTEVVEYFGEDTAKCDTVSIFGVLQEFRNALTNSKNALIRRERSLARAKQAKSPESRQSV